MPDIKIDLAEANRRAQEARALMRDLYTEHDLIPFKISSRIRITQMEILHSRPVLTISTAWSEDRDGFLAGYLHERMHWYLTDHQSGTLETIVP